ncbi:hypothetical protein BCR33DRAFT_729621 [Rhizoclosmatium globosum]|uniref:Uncharacterized protein n=1 Tax=Rhizoclosmatium globosum TaxID=329046 RepID=A0A1Y2AFV0_9FUNG|nr:hypothetical protein BCR33DRAFT_729621 [Rhizoclosmatium globosum]|eukprot:ORY21150.1 hypothetical protein BCR33DRAFT_729621 [Rhizoclosmatium globosum]
MSESIKLRIDSTNMVNINDTIEKIVEQLKRDGHGKYLDRSIPVPVRPVQPKDLRSESDPGLKPRFRGNLKEGDDQTDLAGKVYDDQDAFLEATIRWFDMFKLNVEVSSNLLKSQDQYMKLMKNYTDETTGHEVACGKFANTMDAHKWDQIKSHEDFIKTPTLWKAVDVALKLFGGMDKSGLQFMNWDRGIRSTTIHGNSRSQIIPWRNCIESLKKHITASSALEDLFDEVVPEGQILQLVDKDGKVITKNIKLGSLAVPTLVKHTVYSVVLKSLPESTSTSALAGRLLPVRTALETEGDKAYKTASDLIDKLTEVILFTELNGDGGKTEEEKAKKAFEKAKRPREADSKKDVEKEKDSKKQKRECALCPEMTNHTFSFCRDAKALYEDGKFELLAKKMVLNLPRKTHGAKNANAEREALEAIKQAAESVGNAVAGGKSK